LLKSPVPRANLTHEMTATVRNRLLLLGSAWGVLLAALPALVMARLYAVAGGTLLGPAFGRLIHRAVRGGP
jgi:hypothetical protein